LIIRRQYFTSIIQKIEIWFWNIFMMLQRIL